MTAGNDTLISMHRRIVSSSHTFPSRTVHSRHLPDFIKPTVIGRDRSLSAGVTIHSSDTAGEGGVDAARVDSVPQLAAERRGHGRTCPGRPILQMTLAISVVVPTHAPHRGRLDRTIRGLRDQALPVDKWELVVVNNRSPEPIAIDLAWHPNGRVVREEKLGLTNARRCGATATTGELLVFVDDDNVLAPDYLVAAIELFGLNPQLGAAGGKSVPEWETPADLWVREFENTLAVRDLGPSPLLAGPGHSSTYPACAPIGAGMVIRRAAWQGYESALAKDAAPLLDRTGRSLTSSGDNDIVLRILAAGWQVGYSPELSLAHLIPPSRTTRDYLARLNHGIYQSWVEVLGRHGIRPWPKIRRWTVPLRKCRAYVRYRAWAGPAEYVRWRGACGQFEGQAALD